MTIKEGLQLLLTTEKRMKQEVITMNTIVVGIARAGSKNPVVKAEYVKEVINHNFGGPPHSLVIPSKLHFMEADALITLAKAPEDVKGLVE